MMKLVLAGLMVAATTFISVSGEAKELKEKKFSPNGGKGTVKVVVTDPVEPFSITTSGAGWLSVLPEVTITYGRGKATVTITYVVAANLSSLARTASITVNDTVQPLLQSGTPCTVSLGATTAKFDFYGGEASVSVAAPEDCRWTALAGSDWMNVTGSGIGSGDFLVSAGVNTSDRTRKGNVAIIATNPNTGKTSQKKGFTVIESKRIATAGTAVPGTPTVITAEKAASAAASIRMAAYGAISAVSLFRDSISLGLYGRTSYRIKPQLAKLIQKIAPDKALPREAEKAAVKECSGGGNIRKSGTKFVFDNCIDGDTEYDGTLAISGIRDLAPGTEDLIFAATFTVGTPSKPFVISDSFRSEWYLSLKFSRLNLVDYSFDVRANGSVTEEKTETGAQITTFLDLKNLQISSDESFDDTYRNDVSTDGGLRMTSLRNKELIQQADITFSNFDLSFTEVDETEEIRVNGTYALDSTPANTCIDGTFAVRTLQPVTMSGNEIISGSFSVNSVPITLNGDGSGTATIGGNLIPLPNVTALCPL